MRTLNTSGLGLIKKFEGIADGDPRTVNLDPYLCPAGVWTIGWGHAIRNGAGLLKGKANKAKAFSLYPDGITMNDAETLLIGDTIAVCLQVENATKGVKLNENQFAALVSLVYNIGIGNFRESTLLKKLLGGSLSDAAAQFLVWNKSGANVLPGLVYRREAEKALFCSREK